ncbi:MAG: hypothetical protein HS115_11620 [Spirochaetales bacterium]|nr:hypothetical protein [Spirochaetales bacterium]
MVSVSFEMDESPSVLVDTLQSSGGFVHPANAARIMEIRLLLRRVAILVSEVSKQQEFHSAIFDHLRSDLHHLGITPKILPSHLDPEKIPEVTALLQGKET